MASSKRKAKADAAVADVMFGAGTWVVDQYWRAADGALAAWETVGASFLDGLARDYREAVEAMMAAQSPLEVLGIEQELLQARSNAYLTMAAGLGEPWSHPDGEAKTFHLPD